MAKQLSVGVDGGARKGKQTWIGVDGKAQKIKKMWIGDTNGKANVFWTSDLGFLFSSRSSGCVSSDGISYTYTPNFPTYLDCIVFALGKYWGMYYNYQTVKIYNTVDGSNWTLAATIGGSGHAFDSDVLMRYQNGVFIIMNKHSTAGNKTLAYSTDGVTWTTSTITMSSIPYTFAPYDIRYGTVGGVSGWYFIAKYSGTNTNALRLFRFNSLSDLKSGKVTFVADFGVNSPDGALCIRNGKAYVFATFNGAGDVSHQTNKVWLMSYSGSGVATTIATETSALLGTVWSTDKYFICRATWTDNAGGWTKLQPTYEFSTGKYSNGVSNSGWFHMTPKGIVPFTGVFVGSRMYQVVTYNNSDYNNPLTRGAYSDNYGVTVTIFDISSNVGLYYGCYLVYGDEGGGYYQEQY